ncbi:MAG: hypothetical protein E7A26_15825 [Clostridioides difficile]|jgi:hypothetical protein|nr:hypothetical protein [Clostridioides difficile]
MNIKRCKINKRIKYVRFKGGVYMENVIDLNVYLNDYKVNSVESEWDIIGNIFSKAISRKGLNEKQIENIIIEVEDEVHRK